MPENGSQKKISPEVREKYPNLYVMPDGRLGCKVTNTVCGNICGTEGNFETILRVVYIESDGCGFCRQNPPAPSI